jgi:hypothetical protein
LTTNVTIIGDALLLLGVLAEGQSVPAEHGAIGLRALNQMLERWAVDSIELGYFAQDDTTAECPIPAWAEQGVTSKLAQRLTANYPASQLPAWVGNDEENGFGTILRKMVTAAMKPANMSHMPAGAGATSDFDIQRGY